MERVPDVIDCWFDSGSMPFAQHHYPFENEDRFFDELYPADFISEAIDQTRGWFYSLLAISVFLTGTSSYKRVLVTDLILDKEGRKMSKSKGNTVDPFEMFETYGADAVRWYLLHSSPPWLPKSFDPAGVGEVVSKYFNTLKNVYTFFELYANTDEIDPRSFEIDYEKRPEIDRWLLSKYNNLVKTVIESTNNYDLTTAVRALQEFVNEDLSNWYIRRNRRRFWASELDLSKKAVYATTYEVLVGVAKLMAPFAPFTSEELYRNLTNEDSVHLSMLPEVNENWINPRTEERMDLVRNLVKLGRSARESVNIKVRQPISQVLVDGRYEKLIGDMTDLIKEELNVKEVVFAKDLSEYMKFNLKPNYRVAGPKFQDKVGQFNKLLNQLNAFEVASALEDGKEYIVEFNGEDLALGNELVQVELEAREGFNVRLEKNVFIILDTTLTEELILEGLAREFVSKVQQLRKNHDFDVTDNIHIYYQGDDKVIEAINEHKSWIMKETLALALENKTDSESEEIDLNGHSTEVAVKIA